MLLLVALGLAPWRNGARRGDVLAPPLQGSIELTVWNPALSARQGVRIDDEQAVPLRAGDCVRLAVELNRPAHAYLIWLDADGVPAPLYPWRLGDWKNLPAVCPPAVYIALPEEPGTGWTVRTPRNGMETVLLLARTSPLPVEVNVRDILTAMPRSIIPQRPHVMTFRDGRPQPAMLGTTAPDAGDGNRDPVLDRPVAINDPLLRLQQELVRRLAAL